WSLAQIRADAGGGPGGADSARLSGAKARMRERRTAWERAEPCGGQRRAECLRAEGSRRTHVGSEGRRVPPLRNEARTPIRPKGSVLCGRAGRRGDRGN